MYIFLFVFGFLDGGLEPSNQLELLFFFWYLKVSLRGSYSYRAKRLYGIIPCHGQDISVNDPLFRLSRNVKDDPKTLQSLGRNSTLEIDGFYIKYIPELSEEDLYSDYAWLMIQQSQFLTSWWFQRPFYFYPENWGNDRI